MLMLLDDLLFFASLPLLPLKSIVIQDVACRWRSAHACGGISEAPILGSIRA
jgi:hypothetical protein